MMLPAAASAARGLHVHARVPLLVLLLRGSSSANTSSSTTSSSTTSSSLLLQQQQQHQQRRRLSSDASGGSSPPSCVIYDDSQLPIAPQDLPLPVWECLQQLRAAGHNVLLVGGAVRDLLLGCQPKDWDLLTSAQLHQVKSLFHKPRIIGRTHPICQLTVGDGIRVEISSLHTRQPGSTSRLPPGLPPDAAHILQAGPVAAVAAAAAAGSAASMVGRHGRHRAAAAHDHHHHHHPRPDQQQQLSWAAARQANAAGRDFTVNGLLFDPFQQLMFDYVGGVQDLGTRTLRAIGNPAARFQRDPACLLRAVRCAGRAGLSVEPATLRALQQHSHLVHSLNSQRLTSELMSMLAHGAAGPSVKLLQEAQLLQHLLPLHAAHLQQQQRLQDGGSSSSENSHQQQQWHQQQHQQQRTDGQPAASALGQLLGQLGSAAQRQQQPEGSHKQQQQQQDCPSSLLHRVLAALDERMSVLRPAAPEVVLACLTAPLLVHALTQAVQQLRRHAQASVPAPAVQLHHQSAHSTANTLWAVGHHSSSIDQQLLHQLLCIELQSHAAAAASTARGFSSSTGSNSASSPGGQQQQLSSIARQLLQGSAFAAVMHQEAAALAAQVCSRAGADAAGTTLFGVHTPRLAAGLLAAQLQQRSGQRPERRVASGSSSSSSHDWSGSSRSSRDHHRHQPHHHHLHEHDSAVDDYAVALPRTNRQFKQLMQRQHNELAAGGAGYLGSMRSRDLLLAAAQAAAVTDGSSDLAAALDGGSSNGGRLRQRQQRSMNDDDDGCLLHLVLAAAGVDMLQLQVDAADAVAGAAAAAGGEQ